MQVLLRIGHVPGCTRRHSARMDILAVATYNVILGFSMKVVSARPMLT